MELESHTVCLLCLASFTEPIGRYNVGYNVGEHSLRVLKSLPCHLFTV